MKIKILSLLLCVTFFYGCKVCGHFYSEDKKSIYIKRDLFDLWIQIIRSDLAIDMYPKKSTGEWVLQPTDTSGVIKRPTIKFYPVPSGTQDTLKVDANGLHGLGHYHFLYNREWPEKINLTVLFDMDSLGVIVSKKIEFKNLALTQKCDMDFPRLAH